MLTHVGLQMSALSLDNINSIFVCICFHVKTLHVRGGLISNSCFGDKCQHIRENQYINVLFIQQVLTGEVVSGEQVALLLSFSVDEDWDRRLSWLRRAHHIRQFCVFELLKDALNST